MLRAKPLYVSAQYPKQIKFLGLPGVIEILQKL